MDTMVSQITSLTIVYSTVIQAKIKENIKAPRHWPLCGEFTGTGEFPAQRASNAENVSIWWRHHDLTALSTDCFKLTKKKIKARHAVLLREESTGFPFEMKLVETLMSYIY